MSNVDPIRYAWKCCNVHVPFPAALVRGAMSSSVAASLSNAHANPKLALRAAAVDAAEAALHLFIAADTPRRLAEKMEELAERDAPATA